MIVPGDLVCTITTNKYDNQPLFHDIVFNAKSRCLKTIVGRLEVGDVGLVVARIHLGYDAHALLVLTSTGIIGWCWTGYVNKVEDDTQQAS